MFTNHSIFIRVTVDPELIPGTLSARWDSSVLQVPMHTHAHTFTEYGNLEYPNYLSAGFWEVGGN